MLSFALVTCFRAMFNQITWDHITGQIKTPRRGLPLVSHTTLPFRFQSLDTVKCLLHNTSCEKSQCLNQNVKSVALQRCISAISQRQRRADAAQAVGTLWKPHRESGLTRAPRKYSSPKRQHLVQPAQMSPGEHTQHLLWQRWVEVTNISPQREPNNEESAFSRHLLLQLSLVGPWRRYALYWPHF